MFNNPTRYFVHCVVFSVDSYEISPAACDWQVSNSLYAYLNLRLTIAYIISNLLDQKQVDCGKDKDYDTFGLYYLLTVNQTLYLFRISD